MKKLIVLILGVGLVSSCHKDLDGVAPAAKQSPLNADKNVSIPDSACFKIRILKDSAMVDETAVAFFHFATATYNSWLDAKYFPGYGFGSLATLTADGVPCASQCIPAGPVNTIRLKIGSRESDSYTLKLSYLYKFPTGAHIWLKDRLSGDSVDLRHQNYPVAINKSDTSTFGSYRLKVIVQ